MMKKSLIFLSLLLITLSSCNLNKKEESDFSSEENISESSISEEISEIESEEEIESTSEKTYEKDEQGFYILEDDYFSYVEDISDTKTKNEIYIPPYEDDVPLYNQLRMYIGDKNVPIYNVKTNLSQTWTPDASSRMNNGYATFFLKGKVTIKLQAAFNYLNQVTIRPLNRNVNYEIDTSRRVLIFEITSPGQYVIEMRSGRALHLFVEDINILENNTSNLMYFAPGIHNKNNDSRIDSNKTINLSSNTKVYIAPGAFIYGRFLASNASNITIYGAGYIDGSLFERDASKGTVTVPIEFNYCSNVTLKDFACIDPAGWCFNMYFCNTINIDNVKVISSRSNGDGISIQSCQNVNVTNSFVRSWDDSLVVKNYPRWDNRNIEGTTRHILFKDCVLWTDLAQSMEVGYETVGEVMEDITFDNITVLHNFHKAVFSIHNGNNANIKEVKFKNITVEDASMGKGDGTKILVDFRNVFSTTWSTQHKTTSLGQIDGVEINNVKILSGINNPEIACLGTVENRSGFNHDNHYIKNVSFIDFKLYEDVLDKSYSNYQENDLAININFSQTGKEINGSTFIKPDISEYGNNIIFK